MLPLPFSSNVIQGHHSLSLPVTSAQWGIRYQGPTLLEWRVFLGTWRPNSSVASVNLPVIAMVFNHLCVHGAPGDLVKCTVPGNSSREQDSVVLEQGPGICILDERMAA